MLKLLQNLVASNCNILLFLSSLWVNLAIPLLFFPGLIHMAAFSQSISWAGRSQMDLLTRLIIGVDDQLRCLGSSYGLSSSRKSRLASLFDSLRAAFQENKGRSFRDFWDLEYKASTVSLPLRYIFQCEIWDYSRFKMVRKKSPPLHGKGRKVKLQGVWS